MNEGGLFSFHRVLTRIICLVIAEIFEVRVHQFV